MAEKLKAIRGMHDILPASAAAWQFLEDTVAGVVHRYGYREIRLPVLEKTELFARSIGEQTDIVSKEMYTFSDRNGEQLTLRPEGTASCVRAGLEHGLLHEGVQRLWYQGPMFRYERPQKGRQRQFHQIGVEVFGLDGPDIDAEIIIMCARLWRELGLDDVRLEINTLGTPACRREYRARLVDYFRGHAEQLDDDSHRRLETNPLRILDSKNPDLQDLIAGAPSITEHLDEESRQHFEQLKALLEAAGLSYRVNPRLVRGLDYYNRTVFEWITDALGAQGTVCAGGRYDGLVEHFGGKPTPGIGFAMGLERLIGLLAPGAAAERRPHAYFLVADDGLLPEALRLAEQCRDAVPGLRLILHCGGGSLRSQFKKADKSGASLALILGPEEQERQVVSIKHLRGEAEQFDIEWQTLAKALQLQLDL